MTVKDIKEFLAKNNPPDNMKVFTAGLAINREMQEIAIYHEKVISPAGVILIDEKVFFLC